MSIRRSIGFTTILIDFTRKGAPPEEAAIHTAELTVIKVALKEIHKREDKRWIISRLSELYAIH